MKILLIGSGGREHALARALRKSPSTSELYCTPGNPGIFQVAENPELNSENYKAIIDFCKSKSIDLVVVGPEQPLSKGISNYLRKNNINVFGPDKLAARLETSKGWAKDFMFRLNIPTAAYKTFGYSEVKEAHSYINSRRHPIVLKADGLAAGKGVIICSEPDESHKILDSMFSGTFGESGRTVVIEDYLRGEEASILTITDGNDFVTLAPSQDHKRIGDEDTGLNTGGMGAYAPAPIITDTLLQKVKDQVLTPAIEGMRKEGNPFIGCLYAGLMISEGELYVIEFNVRFGDPEAQAVLSILEGDFAELLYSASIGKINKAAVNTSYLNYACCIILASEGYPGNYQKGFKISDIEKAEEMGAIVYHAGTSESGGDLFTTGGRVLGVTGIGSSLKESIDKAYLAVNKIKFENMYFRKDIGQKGIERG